MKIIYSGDPRVSCMGLPAPKITLKDNDDCTKLIKASMGNMLAVGYSINREVVKSGVLKSSN